MRPAGITSRARAFTSALRIFSKPEPSGKESARVAPPAARLAKSHALSNWAVVVSVHVSRSISCKLQHNVVIIVLWFTVVQVLLH